MDLQKKIQERRLEREAEEKYRQAQEKQTQSDQRKFEVEKARDLLKKQHIAAKARSNPQSAVTEGIKDQSDTDEKLGAKAEDLDAATKDVAQKDAEKLINDEAGKRVGGFSTFVMIVLLGYGIYQLFASGWIGVLWIVAGVAFFAFRMDQERKKLLDQID